MNILAPADRVRLTKLLGMLGSAHDGERASAGAAADRLIRQRGLVWNDIIQPIDAQPTLGQQRYQTCRDNDLDLALRSFDACSIWEQDFLRSVAMRASMSPKQRTVVQNIAQKLRARGFL